MEKTPIQLAAEELLAAGGRRYEAGESVLLLTGTTVKVLTGWAAIRGNRVYCVGTMSVTRPRAVTRCPAP